MSHLTVQKAWEDENSWRKKSNFANLLYFSLIKHQITRYNSSVFGRIFCLGKKEIEGVRKGKKQKKKTKKVKFHIIELYKPEKQQLLSTTTTRTTT